jgi:hypothetical protein
MTRCRTRYALLIQDDAIHFAMTCKGMLCRELTEKLQQKTVLLWASKCKGEAAKFELKTGCGISLCLELLPILKMDMAIMSAAASKVGFKLYRQQDRQTDIVKWTQIQHLVSK